MGDGESVSEGGWGMEDGESVRVGMESVYIHVGGWGMERVRVGGEVGEVTAIQHIIHSTIH